MQIDDETTAIQLQKILVENGHPLSLNTILRSRDRLGWTFRGSAYCQMIREQNKEKRLDWARLYLDESQSNGFQDVLYTDESSIMLESHKRFCCRKTGQPAKPKPCLVYCFVIFTCTYYLSTIRPKHLTKVHIWAGISWHGKTPIVIFDGKMNAASFIEVI